MGEMTEREHTDESLRLERDTTDHAIAEEQAAIDEVAGAVLSRARARADAVLAAARARADLEKSSSPALPTLVERERVLADQVLQGERTKADEVLKAERTLQGSVFSHHRKETDDDLALERVVSDDIQVILDGVLDVLRHNLGPRVSEMIGLARTVAQGLAQEHDQLRMSAFRLHRISAEMNRVIDDVIDIARLDAGSFSVTREAGDPTEVVMEAVEAFQAQAAVKRVSLSADIGPAGARATFDPARILQVLTNLVSEAIKRTSTDGAVRVHVESSAELVRVTVSDTGRVIPTDELARMFDRFHGGQARPVGSTHLRLYICKCIVERHGGELWAAKNDGGGNTFGFTLPG